jgi:hypothetical protein
MSHFVLVDGVATRVVLQAVADPVSGLLLQARWGVVGGAR